MVFNLMQKIDEMSKNPDKSKMKTDGKTKEADFRKQAFGYR